MKKNRLFWRIFGAFLATLMLTATVISMMMVVMVRDERAAALENEVRMQARDVARLMRQYDLTSIWQRDSSVATTLNWKIDEIQKNYNADVWLVSAARRVWVLGSNEYDQAQLNDETVVQYVTRVLSGEEIRVQGLIPELGSHMVTIGVPWRDSSGWVGGAVLLHISTESLSVDYGDLIRNAALATTVAMALGAGLALLIARRQAEPIRQIRVAVSDFAAGRLERRVAIKADSELMELADAFNGMATQLMGLEQSRRRFVASVSHELRSPLTCIKGYIAGMLDGTIEMDDREKYMSVVLSETERLSKLVSELLDLSRIESGVDQLTLTRFDISELVRLELIKFEGRIEQKRIEVEVELPDAPLTVQADADQLRQVLTNLMDNAVKFTNHEGRIAVAVVDAGTKAKVAVFNTGPAIEDEDLPHIFDRFYTADKAHTPGSGTGLGLSIIKKILDLHGETIAVSTGPIGTTFTFTVKKPDRQDAIDAAPQRLDAPPGKPDPRHNGLRNNRKRGISDEANTDGDHETANPGSDDDGDADAGHDGAGGTGDI